MTPDGVALPDEKSNGGVRWAPGALDGLIGHHRGSANEKLRVKQLQKAIRDLLSSATGILTALASEGPAKGLGDYAPSEQVVASWLEHVRRRPITFHGIRALDALHNRLELSDGLKQQIEQMRRSETVRLAIFDGLALGDEASFDLSAGAAALRDIDTFQHHFARLQERRGSTVYHLFGMMKTVAEERIDTVLELAASRISFEKIATGPALEFGLGPEY